MKKLLSLIGAVSLTASIPAPLMANTLNRPKRDISTTAEDVTNNY
jgi:hypothetical protein